MSEHVFKTNRAKRLSMVFLSECRH